MDTSVMKQKEKALALLYDAIRYCILWHGVGSVKYTTKIANDPTSFRLIELGFAVARSFLPLLSVFFVSFALACTFVKHGECVNKYVLYPCHGETLMSIFQYKHRLERARTHTHTVCGG